MMMDKLKLKELRTLLFKMLTNFRNQDAFKKGLNSSNKVKLHVSSLQVARVQDSDSTIQKECMILVSIPTRVSSKFSLKDSLEFKCLPTMLTLYLTKFKHANF